MRRLGFVLAALIVVLVTLFGAMNPPATAAPGAQTCLGAHTPEVQVVVGTHDGINAGEGVRNSPSTDDSALAAGVAVNPTAATPRPALEYCYDGAAPSYDASVRSVDAQTVVQVQAVGSHATAVSLRGPSGAVSHRPVVASGCGVAAVIAASAGAGWGGAWLGDKVADMRLGRMDE